MKHGRNKRKKEKEKVKPRFYLIDQNLLRVWKIICHSSLCDIFCDRPEQRGSERGHPAGWARGKESVMLYRGIILELCFGKYIGVI